MTKQNLTPGKSQLKDHLTVIKIDVLPPQIRVFVAIIGLSETIALLQAQGGMPLRVPENPDQAQVLPQVISMESIIKLCDSHLAGKVLSCPKVDKLLQQVRNTDILSNKGLRTRRELAQQYDLTTRHVQNIWSNGVSDLPVNDAPDEQMKLEF